MDDHRVLQAVSPVTMERLEQHFTTKRRDTKSSSAPRLMSPRLVGVALSLLSLGRGRAVV
jgi:hypothetical protein